MSNKKIVTKWKTLGIVFKGKRNPHKLSDIFMICWGETDMEMADGTKEKVVVLDVGGEMGNPALFCSSDKDDNCWEYGFDSKQKKVIKRNIGRFVSL